MTHLDTHVVVWLYEGDASKFPKAVRKRLDAGPLAVSPLVELELQYLFEIGRITVAGPDIVGHLRDRIGLTVLDTPFPTVVRHATPLGWTRDPFDRLIVATSAAEDAPLLTRDEVIRKHHALARWG